MFQEPTANNTTEEPEDILAEVEPSAEPIEPLVVGPKGPISPIPPVESRGERKKFITLLVVVLIIVLIGFSAWLTYAKLIRINQGEEVAESPAPTITAVQQEPQQTVEPPANLDSDSDGLLDSEEVTAQTDPFKSDTDGDNLTDYEEIKIYRTDPLNPDTDGDGYLDGEEVDRSYDPKDPTYGAKLEE